MIHPQCWPRVPHHKIRPWCVVMLSYSCALVLQGRQRKSRPLDTLKLLKKSPIETKPNKTKLILVRQVLFSAPSMHQLYQYSPQRHSDKLIAMITVMMLMITPITLSYLLQSRRSSRWSRFQCWGFRRSLSILDCWKLSLQDLQVSRYKYNQSLIYLLPAAVLLNCHVSFLITKLTRRHS